MYSSLLNFLKNPNKEFDFDKDLNTTVIKSELKGINPAFCISPKKNSISLDLDNSISDEAKPTSIAKKLFDAIQEIQKRYKIN